MTIYSKKYLLHTQNLKEASWSTVILMTRNSDCILFWFLSMLIFTSHEGVPTHNLKALLSLCLYYCSSHTCPNQLWRAWIPWQTKRSLRTGTAVRTIWEEKSPDTYNVLITVQYNHFLKTGIQFPLPQNTWHIHCIQHWPRLRNCEARDSTVKYFWERLIIITFFFGTVKIYQDFSVLNMSTWTVKSPQSSQVYFATKYLFWKS